MVFSCIGVRRAVYLFLVAMIQDLDMVLSPSGGVGGGVELSPSHDETIRQIDEGGKTSETDEDNTGTTVTQDAAARGKPPTLDVKLRSKVNTRQTSQDKSRQDKTGQDKARQDETRRDRFKQIRGTVQATKTKGTGKKPQSGTNKMNNKEGEIETKQEGERVKN
jgi:hypothetical protein